MVEKMTRKPLGGSSHNNIFSCIFSSTFTFRWIGCCSAWKESVIHAFTFLYTALPRLLIFIVYIHFVLGRVSYIYILTCMFPFFLVLIYLSTCSLTMASLLWFLFYWSPEYRIFFSSGFLGCYVGWDLSSLRILELFFTLEWWLSLS